MALGRIAKGVVLAIGLFAFRMKVSPLANIYGALIAGIPRIITQLIIILILVVASRRVIKENEEN